MTQRCSGKACSCSARKQKKTTSIGTTYSSMPSHTLSLTDMSSSPAHEPFVLLDDPRGLPSARFLSHAIHGTRYLQDSIPIVSLAISDHLFSLSHTCTSGTMIYFQASFPPDYLAWGRNGDHHSQPDAKQVWIVMMRRHSLRRSGRRF